MTAEHFTKDLHEVENEVCFVIGDIDTAEYLLSEQIQNLGRDNETVHAAIAVCAVLERAAAHLESAENELHRLTTAGLGPTGEPGEVPTVGSSTGEENSTTSQDGEQREVADRFNTDAAKQDLEQGVMLLHASLLTVRGKWVGFDGDEEVNALLQMLMASLGRAGELIDRTSRCFDDWHWPGR